MDSLAPDVMLSVTEQVLSRQAAGETVLLNLADERYFGLDGVGTRVFELIQGGTTFGAAVAVIVDEYDVDPAVASADLSALVNDLVTNGLVSVAT
jgi:hypothetical protein